MTNEKEEPAAWAVPVWTERLGGGRPMLVLYAATVADKVEAVTLAKKHAQVAEGDDVREPYPLSQQTVDALGLPPNHTRML